MEDTLTSFRDQTVKLELHVIIEQSFWITKWRLAGKKSYTQGFTEEATMRLVRRTETRERLALLQQTAAEALQGYVSSGGFPLRRMGPKPQSGLPNPEHQSLEEVPT